jgi:uncharacterized repeat protein (TIGR02543 family)
VTYNASPGTVSPGTATVSAGSPVTLPTPSRASYTCTGWYTAASGGTKVGNTAASYTPTGNITLYAQWLSTPVISEITFTSNELGLHITWTGSGATSYKLYRAASKNATYSQIATPSSAVHDDMVDLTSVGTSYWYKVRSVTAGVESNESAAKGITVTNPVVYVFGRTSQIGRGIRIEIGGSVFTFTGNEVKSSPSGFSGYYVTPDVEITPGNKTYRVDNYARNSTTWAGWFDFHTYNFKPLHAYGIEIDKDSMYSPDVYPELTVDD